MGLKLSLFGKDPLPEGVVVPLHDNDVGVVDNSIVVHLSNPIIQPKVLQASNLSKNIMEDASLIYAFGEVHLFDSNLFGLVNVSFATVNDSVCS